MSERTGEAHRARASARDERAIEALLAGATMGRAATEAGMSAQTLAKRLRDPTFLRRIEDGRRMVISRATSALTSASIMAVNALVQVIGNPNAADRDRIAASRVVLDHALGQRVAVTNVESGEANVVIVRSRLEAIQRRLADAVIDVPAIEATSSNGHVNGDEDGNGDGRSAEA
jgi:hypothetical protein